MSNIYCDICKKYHNKRKLHTQLEKDIQSGNSEKIIKIIAKICLGDKYNV